MKLRTPAAAILALLLATAAVIPAVAADGDEVTWAVKPATSQGPDGRAYFNYSIDPGTAVDDFISISNLGADAETFTLYGTDAINDFETGAFGLLPATGKPTDAGSWIHVLEPSVTIEPGRQAIVPVQLVVPSDATPGDHTAGVIASVSSASTNDQGQAVKLDLRVAARMYIRIAGALVPEVQVTGLTSSFTPSLNPFAAGTATVDYAVANTGNVRLDVEQLLAVTGPFGLPLGGAAPAAISNLLPGQSAHVTVQVDEVGAAGLVFGKVTLSPAPAGGTNAAAVLPAAGATEPGAADPAATDPAADDTATADTAQYTTVSSESAGLAVSWTLLALILLVILAVYLIVRWMRRTRVSFYDAVDAAVAKADHDRADQAERETVGAARE